MPTTSRTIVRTAITQFFGGATYDTNSRAYRGAIPASLFSAGLSTVRAYQPKRLNDIDYVKSQAAGRGMGAYMQIEVPFDVEIRRALPGITGRKRITYQVVLHIFHLAHEAYAEDAEADVDGLVEAVKDLMHTDPTLGSACYQAGESSSGIRTRIYPSSLGHDEIVATYAQISFDAEVEIVA